MNLVAKLTLQCLEPFKRINNIVSPKLFADFLVIQYYTLEKLVQNEIKSTTSTGEHMCVSVGMGMHMYLSTDF